MHKLARRTVFNPVVDTENRIIRERYEQRKVDRFLGFLLRYSHDFKVLWFFVFQSFGSSKSPVRWTNWENGWWIIITASELYASTDHRRSLSNVQNGMWLNKENDGFMGSSNLCSQYLNEEGEKGMMLKETTAKEIIKLVAPTRRKNLTCVDEKISEGMRVCFTMWNNWFVLTSGVRWNVRNDYRSREEKIHH